MLGVYPVLVVQLQRSIFIVLYYRMISLSILQYNTMIYFYKDSLIDGSYCDRGHFMKNSSFNVICNITQIPQELER